MSIEIVEQILELLHDGLLDGHDMSFTNCGHYRCQAIRLDLAAWELMEEAKTE